MTIIDPSTPLGKIRLRVGDWSDLPILPDTVINSALTDCQNSVPRAAALCAQYILATLSFKTHRKLAQLETWSSEQFKQYKEFLQLTVLNPHMMTASPVPYTGTVDTEHPLIVFVNDWNKSYYGVDDVLDVTGGSM
jgi:hypothetical protein